MMKIVLFADLHLDTPFRWAPPTAARHRRQALRDTLDSIVQLAADEEADALCCAGDLYEHDMVAPDTGECIRAAFERLHPTPVLVAPGNHDWLGSASVYRRVDWSPNVHIFERDRLEPHELTTGFTVWGAAHRRPAGTHGFLDDFRVDRDGVNLALFHGALRAHLPFQGEGKQAHAPFDAEQIPASGLDHALVGHFHVPADERWYTYPGNPEALTFGETGERGAVVVEVAGDGSVTRTRHAVAQTVLQDLTIDLTGCASLQEVRQRAEDGLANAEGIVRAWLTGEVDPAVSVDPTDLDGVASHLEWLVVRLDGVRAAYDIEAIAAQISTVRGRFVKEVLDSDLHDELKRKVVVTGLRALDGRDDLEVR